jgi:hypothetical protein
MAFLVGERVCAVFVHPRRDRRCPDFKALSATWHNSFMQLLTENCRLDDVADRFKKLVLVVFNYDRCIEHYLYHALQEFYGVPDSTAATLLKELTIYHPYGKVGELPWAQRGPTTVDFGGRAGGKHLLDLARQIKTFTEGTDPQSSDIRQIRKHYLDSSVVLFLGFAYHKLNLSVLQSKRGHKQPDQVRYYGTAKGMSKSDCEIVKEELVAMAGARPEFVALRNDLTCHEFFQEYWRSLSLA